MRLNTAPVYMHFPAKGKPKAADTMDIQRVGFSAEAIAKWISERTDIQVLICLTLLYLYNHFILNTYYWLILYDNFRFESSDLQVTLELLQLSCSWSWLEGSYILGAIILILFTTKLFGDLVPWYILFFCEIYYCCNKINIDLSIIFLVLHSHNDFWSDVEPH